MVRGEGRLDVIAAVVKQQAPTTKFGVVVFQLFM